MQKEVVRLTEENEILKNCGRFSGLTSQVARKTRFSIVQSLLKQHFKLAIALRLLKIPKSTWAHNVESNRHCGDNILKDLLHDSW